MGGLGAEDGDEVGESSGGARPCSGIMEAKDGVGHFQIYLKFGNRAATQLVKRPV